MQKQVSFLFMLCLAIGAVLGVVAPVRADTSADVAALVENVRNHQVVDDRSLRAALPHELLLALRNHLSDPSKGVRLFVVGQAVTVGSRHLSSQEIRQEVAALIVTIATTDADDSIAAYAAELPANATYFSRADFTDAMRRDILELVKLQNPRREFLLLAGVAGVTDATERLRELTAQGERTAALALARMGDPVALDDVLQRFEAFKADTSGDRITKATRMLERLAYTRQPAAVDVLVRYLFSEERLPSVREGTPGTKVASRALDLLAQIIEDFPIKSVGPSYSDAEIEQARSWITDHRDDLKIKR